MSSLLIYLCLLTFSATVLSGPNSGLFFDGSGVNTFGDLEEPDQVFGASYNSLLATSSPSEPPTDNWKNPPAEPINLQEIAVQQERFITNDVPLKQVARPTRGDDGIWHFNRSPPSQDSTNSCPAGFQPLGKRQVCSIDPADEWTQHLQSPYNPEMNFLLTLSSYPPSDHREPCGLFSGAPRWAICDSANSKDQYPAGITIAKATLCMPLIPPLPKKRKERKKKLQQADNNAPFSPTCKVNIFFGCFIPHKIWCCYFFYITDLKKQTGVGNFCDLYTTFSH